jgi:hypothetical protein
MTAHVPPIGEPLRGRAALVRRSELNSLRQWQLGGEIDRVRLTSPDILTPSPMSAEPVTRGFDIGYVLASSGR